VLFIAKFLFLTYSLHMMRLSPHCASLSATPLHHRSQITVFLFFLIFCGVFLWWFLPFVLALHVRQTAVCIYPTPFGLRWQEQKHAHTHESFDSGEKQRMPTHCLHSTLTKWLRTLLFSDKRNEWKILDKSHILSSAGLLVNSQHASWIPCDLPSRHRISWISSVFKQMLKC
jgi:hypothetical protein